MARKAIIDVGSKSVKFFLGELAADKTIKTIIDTNDIAGLGEGMEADGNIQPEPMARNVAAVANFAKTAKENGADQIIGVGTAALRKAGNSAEFLKKVKDACGVEIQIIPGEEEARLSYLAILSGLPIGKDEDLVVFDTGGGSTEFIFGHGTNLVKRFSVPLGSVRITEAFLKSDPVTDAEVKAAIAQIDKEFAEAGVAGKPAKLVGMGGTVTSMGAVKHKMVKYDANVIQGSTLTKEDIASQIKDYSSRTIEQRMEIPGLQPKRADVILTGALILKVITDRLDAKELTISDRGLRHGLAFDLFQK